MMIVSESIRVADADLDDPRRTALARFAVDVTRFGGDDALIAAYRAALMHAGAPMDAAWKIFTSALRQFVLRLSPATREQQEAAARLNAIVGENADLLA